jgi:hypothetical protein
MLRTNLKLLVTLAATLGFAGLAVAAEWPHYELAATIDPDKSQLAIATTIELPENRAGTAVEFVLGAGFTVSKATPAATAVAATQADTAFSGINSSPGDAGTRRYRVQLPAGERSFKLEYSGPVDRSPAASPEEYARSFAETPGIVNKDGIYLAGSTFWYPQLAGEDAAKLVTYSLTINTPTGWEIVAPGNGRSSGPDGKAIWDSPTAIDEITVSGGPLQVSRAMVGDVEAQVYLRQPDPALASRYLEATDRYLRMYSNLLGPYPYKKFALVENFWETGYGMPSYTLLGPQIIRFPFILTSSYPHEILHNWWGNSVYVDYVTGNWCEGLTAYLADHLMKEGEGQGDIYRRDVLKKYRDFVGLQKDFPLSEFKSRNSAASEAVGYGKTLMGFHGVRQRIGDDQFRAGLRQFYRDYRGQRASFANIQKVFEEVSGQDLDRYFTDLVTRTGMADLVVTDVKTTARDGGYVVSGVLRQRQAEAPFELDVPIVLTTATGAQRTVVRSQDRETRFSINADGPVTAVAVDPAFDVMRRLDARETAPSLGQLFGAAEVTAVLPSASPAEAAAWREAITAWQSPSRKINVVTDQEIKAIPADRPAWILGRNNRLAKTVGSDAGIGLAVDDTGVTAGGKEWPYAGNSHVITRRHPQDPSLAIGWIAADDPVAIAALGRKLPHYGKYSWLVFAGSAADNVGKGEWATPDSPLNVNLAGAGKPLQLASLTPPRPLAEPPPSFDAGRLMAHVQYLAAPEREGRGFGSAGLEAAANYVRDQFAAAGLKPGGDNGGWFQVFTAKGGPDNVERELKNVIAVLPGADPAFKGEAAVISAHYDHLGLGWPGARVDALGKVHPGADDNASGVAVLLEVARRFAAGPPPPRTIIFAAWSGEEAGLLGARHFVQNPVPVPVGGLVGVINIDTVGSLGDLPVSVLATDSAREWPFVFSGITAVTGVPTRSIPGASQSSDQQAFIDVGVPGVQLFTAATGNYHQPTDTPDTIDAAGLAKVAIVAAEAVSYLASTDKRPAATGKGVGAGGEVGRSERRRVTLGAVPEFGYTGPGVRVDSVVDETPAAKAGIQKGDVIIALGGKPVADLNGFTALLRNYGPGDRTVVRWRRGDVEEEREVELAAR